MSLCVNSECRSPHNLGTAEVCSSCGSQLLLRMRYRPIRILGKGTFGQTLLAIDEDIPYRPYCAVKQFHFSSPHPEVYFRDNLMQPGTEIGTRGYAPPEQMINGKVNQTSDLYSLGVTCVRMLTGTPTAIEMYDTENEICQWQEYLPSKAFLNFV